MNFLSKNIRKIYSIIFLGIFLTFLGLSFSHTHHFNISYNLETNVDSQKSNKIQDIFLNSASNCILHTFANSLKIDKTFRLSENVSKLDLTIVVPLTQYYTNNLSELTHLLRAPPNYLV